VYSHLLLSFVASRGTLRVGDHLDPSGEVQLRRCIEDALGAGCTRLDVDCRRVRRIERPALAALADAKQSLESRGGTLVVTGRSAAFTRAAVCEGFREFVQPVRVPR
jgi:anti-anti-sigma regulatory factor